MMDSFNNWSDFCLGEPLWDTNITWYTATPQFTRCFQHTIPTWIPALLLWLFAPIEVYFTIRRYRRRRHDHCSNNSSIKPPSSPLPPLQLIPYNVYNVTRFLAVAILVLVNGVQFFYDLSYYLSLDSITNEVVGDDQPRQRYAISIADLTSSLLNVFTLTLFGFIIALHRVYGKHTSGLVWLYTFIAMIISLPTVYMYVRFYDYHHHHNHNGGGGGTLSSSTTTSTTTTSPTPLSSSVNGDDPFHHHHRSSPTPIIGDTIEMILFAIHFGLLVILFLLTCFADENPTQSSSSVKRRMKKLKLKEQEFEMKEENGVAPVDHDDEKVKCLNKKDGAAASFADGNDDGDDKDSGFIDCPEQRASFLSFITYWWFNSLARLGFRKALTFDDLWRLNPEDCSDQIAPEFDRRWNAQLRTTTTTTTGTTTTTKTSKPGIVTTLLCTFGLTFLSGAIFKITHDTLQFVPPQLLKHFIEFVSKPATVEPLWHGFAISIAFFIVSTIQSVMLNYYFHTMYIIAMRVRSSLISAIYRKTLHLSNGARRDTTTGEIVNLMSVDAQRFVDMLPFVNLMWSAPYQIVLTIYFLWAELGPSVLAGLAVMVCMVPLNGYFSAYQRRLQIKQMKKKDERVKVMNEVLNGMKVIKLYGWEVPFIGKLTTIRNSELRNLQHISYISAFTSFLWTCAPFVVSFVTFALYVLSSDENVLDAKKAFVSLALFNLLRFPLTMLPQMITMVVMASVSVKRLNRYLNSEELEQYVSSDVDGGGGGGEIVIQINDGNFCWEQPKDDDDDDNDSDGEKKNSKDKKQARKKNKPNKKSKNQKNSKEEEKLLNNGNGNADQQQQPKNPNENGTTAASDVATAASTANSMSSKHLPFKLANINLSIKRGSMVAIVGHVGSGKSSLLSAILGDMERITGKVVVKASETLSYVAQQAWIQNATLRENILFGRKYDRKRYRQVVEWCALKPDIAILPGGDETEIGEKGINLSGGQKQRVAIARACYAPSSVVLMDDPLSAVDSHVARHIFDSLLSNSSGALRHRTRVLVTNNIAILPDMDQIVVMSRGAITEIGTYTELMADRGSKFAEFVREYSDKNEKGDASGMIAADDSLSLSASLSGGGGGDQSTSKALLRQRTLSIESSKSLTLSRQRSEMEASLKQQQANKLTEMERTETGNVKWSVYAQYFRSLTCLWLILMVAGFIAMQTASVMSNVWLAIWSNDHSIRSPSTLQQPLDNSTEASSATNFTITEYDNITTTTTSTSTTTIQTEEDITLRNQRLAVYGALGLAQAIFILLGSFAMAKGTVNSSSTWHRTLLERIMRSPMSFFDTTPLGRIVNHFSKDIDTVDTTIPHTLRGWFVCFLQVVSTFLLITIEVPIFMVVASIILALYYFIQKYYVATSRQLKRLESVTRSPIYSHFSETLSGVSTIRAYGAMDRFIEESNRRVDANQRCYFPSVIANRWLALRLEFCGNLIVFAAAAFSVFSRETFQTKPGFIGLIITYALSVTQVLNWLVRMTSELETNVVSVERLAEYCENVTEREWIRSVNEDPILSPDWPSLGVIQFLDYSFRYREGLDLVLHGITVHIKQGEKIGIVGRTGAGKSSLTLALFRIVESAGGHIEIDGIDTSRIGLHELRSKLSIIPQDPILFSGTIRSNLDPFGTKTDEELWRALEHCHLRAYIATLDAGLDHKVAENGENLSVGQRQLVCLGRALLRRTRILVLDEATAAIDLETDALIQATIREEFAHATVLTIAHRLHTIMDSDRILVLDHGRVAEFDTPATLLADRRSKFYSLAKDAGIV